jgi:HNH endonuclease
MKTKTALAALVLLVNALPALAGDYVRPNWSKAEGCRDTRAVVLAAQCSQVTWSANGCSVRAAVCPDLYSGFEIATDSAGQALHVDHLYPASAAWHGREWTKAEFQAFFNDQENLIVVRARTNMRKGDDGPGGWCPLNIAARPVIAAKYRATAAKWSLPISKADEVGLRAWERGECGPGARIL